MRYSFFSFMGAQIWLVVGLILLSSPSALAQSAIYLEADDLTVRLRSDLRIEQQNTATASTSADLLVTVERAEGELITTIADASGNRVLHRRISLAGGLQPALRRILLLIVRAAEVSAEVDPPPLVPKEEPGFVVGIAAGMAASFWTSQPEPMLGPALSIQLDAQDWIAGLRVVLGGLPCCRREEQGISADVLEIAILGDFRLPVVEVEPIRLLGVAGAGINWVRVEARPDAYETSDPIQEVFAVEPVLLLGVSLEWTVTDPLALLLSLGVEHRFFRTRVSLPDFYEGSESLDPGLILPWAEIALQARLF